MNITLTKAHGTDIGLDHFRKVYFEAFPDDERRPWDDITDKIHNGHDMFSAYMIMNGDNPVGFITAWQFPEAAYIEHFAIDRTYRQHGLGALAIDAFLSLVSTPVVLEVELPGTDPMAERRIDFYRRHGFTAHHGFKYIQPPYTAELKEVPMMLMTRGDIDLDKARRLLHHFVYEAI